MNVTEVVKVTINIESPNIIQKLFDGILGVDRKILDDVKNIDPVNKRVKITIGGSEKDAFIKASKGFVNGDPKTISQCLDVATCLNKALKDLLSKLQKKAEKSKNIIKIY